MCRTHWSHTNNFLFTKLTAWRPFRAQKSELPTTRPSQLVLILLLVPKSLLHGIPITATAQDLHHVQYLQPPKSQTDQTVDPPSPPKKISTLHHIAILVPHDGLGMKSYMHVWFTTILSPTLNTRTKKHRAVFPHFGHFQFAEGHKVETIIWYTPSNSTF